MMRPSLEEAKAVAQTGSYRVIPVSRELYSDIKTPMEVLRILEKRQPSLLHAGEH